jgi:multidrug efflux pump
MLTLYTTPVVYLALDRLRLRVLGKERDTFHPSDTPVAAGSE